MTYCANKTIGAPLRPESLDDIGIRRHAFLALLAFRPAQFRVTLGAIWEAMKYGKLGTDFATFERTVALEYSVLYPGCHERIATLRAKEVLVVIRACPQFLVFKGDVGGINNHRTTVVASRRKFLTKPSQSKIRQDVEGDDVPHDNPDYSKASHHAQ